MRTVYGDHQRFVDTYFTAYPGKYFTGDGCRRDADGYYWITGRVDDVINVAGHRLGTAEVESALVAHPKVSEAAVVGYPHDIKGQGIYAYVTLMAGEQPSEELRKELVAWVRKEIGPIASPDLIQFAPGLPKTRSGKIMRRILRKIAEDEYGNLGDTSTLADPARGRRPRRQPAEQEGARLERLPATCGQTGDVDRGQHPPARESACADSLSGARPLPLAGGGPDRGANVRWCEPFPLPNPPPQAGADFSRNRSTASTQFPCAASPSVYRQSRAEKTRKPYSRSSYSGAVARITHSATFYTVH